MSRSSGQLFESGLMVAEDARKTTACKEPAWAFASDVMKAHTQLAASSGMVHVHAGLP